MMKKAKLWFKFGFIFLLFGLTGVLIGQPSAPVCRLGVISTPYITTQTAEELGPKRNFLTRTGPAGLAEAFRLAQEQKISTLVILGDLTWTGSESDLEKLEGLLASAPVRIILVPGGQDLSGGQEKFVKIFQKYGASVRFSTEINGVRLLFNGLPLEKDEQQNAFLDWLDKDISLSENSQGVILFGQMGKLLSRSADNLPEPIQRFRKQCREYKVAAAVIPGHSHNCDLIDTLPVWSAPSAGWPGEGNYLGIISVYREKVELSLYRSQQPFQTLTVPNPVKAKRLDPAKDPSFLVPYTEDLARKPELTFVLSGDPQFDDLTLEKYKGRFSAVETMNKAL
ncbi:MAG: hypothetical protein NC911_06295, partial [Candidatus Omnitrophica bacterium]|nr:hypothetical protein [Candidatus Omnitrophota bacterium]